jgi:inosine-uridine nucleoside N-ribohydrolase
MALSEGPLEFAGAFSSPRTEPQGLMHDGLRLLIHEIETNPGKIRILAIGPLTNIAILLRLRPDLAAKIASITIMGGALTVPGNANKTAEFNFWFDPEAAAIVLRSPIPNKNLIPLDVCNTATVTKTIFDSIASAHTPISDLYRDDFGNGYPGFLKNPGAEGKLWDEMAAAVLIAPSLVMKSSTKYLDVSTTFGPQYGATTALDPKLYPEATPVRVIETVDVPRTFAIYEAALTAHSSR